MKARNERWQEMRAEEDKQIEDSKNAMALETGIPRSHPKFEKAWNIAYEEGHSSGLTEVEYYFRQLADLLKP